jgi:arginase
MSSDRRDEIVILGVPIDSVGAEGGTEHGPAALREALAPLGLADAGDTSHRLRGGHRDPETGWLDFDDVLEMTSEVRGRIAELAGGGQVPLVLGGCCTLLPGALAGARDVLGECGLAFVDGHMDTYEGHSSPTGEGADMPVATVIGRAPAALLERLGGPAGDPARISLIGYRDPDEAADVPTPVELGIGEYRDRDSIRGTDLAQLGEAVAARLGGERRFWLHLDVDVLGAEEFPATDYLMPDGLDLGELERLLTPLLRSPQLAGANISCFNPEKDPDGAGAAALAGLLARALGGRS